MTGEINGLLENEMVRLVHKKDQNGLVHLFLMHTTAALTISELDTGTDLDLLEAFEKIVPKMNYRHSRNPSHMGGHILSSLIGPCLTLPYNKNGLILGAWQRVVLIAFDGPRERRIIISFL